MPPFTPLVASLPATVPFVGPEEQERARGRPFAARIGANENGFGPSPRVLEALAEAAGDVWRYPDPTAHELTAALAARLDVPAAAIRAGEGIDGLLGVAVRLFVGPSETVVTSDGAYPTFNYHVAGFGGRLVRVPYREDAADPEALAEAARRHGARIVYLANPDNPMGSALAAETVLRLRAALPGDCLLFLDEAYAEFAPAGTVPELDVADTRTIRFRTFSKAYGLAGLRVGYAVAHPEVAAAFDRVRNHFGLNRLAQTAALTALADDSWLAAVRRSTARGRERIGAAAEANGLAALPSATNFVAIDCGRDGAFARRVLQGLIERDVFVRMPGVAPLDRTIRVTAGPTAEMARFAEALPLALADAAAEATADA